MSAVVIEAREPSARYLPSGAPSLIGSFGLATSAPGAVEKLRALVLSLAVRGKLTAQDTADEPASRRLAAMHVAPLADGPFALPSNWAWASLGSVVEVIRGITFPASEKTREPGPNRVACLRTTNVQRNVEWDDLLFIDRSFVARAEQFVRRHDIVMSMANSRELVGKVALIDQIPHLNATFGGFLGVLRPREVEPRYVMAVLCTAYARSSLIDSASQTTNIANISLAKLRPLPLPVPPLAEQHRIVARVEELMKLCDALEAKGRLADEQYARLTSTLFGLLAASESPQALAENWQRIAEHFDLLLDRPEAIDALEQVILELAVRGLLVKQEEGDEPASVLMAKVRAAKDQEIAAGSLKRDKPTSSVQDAEIPYALPSGWRWVRLAEVVTKLGAGSTPLGGKDVYTSAGIKFLRSQNVWTDGLRLSDVARIPSATHEGMAATVVKPNDLLFNITGASIGRCALVPSDFDEANVSQHVTIVRPALVETRHFLHLVLISSHVQRTVQSVQVGVSREGLSIAKLGQFAVPLPPLAEQHRIVARVDELRRLCTQLRERLAAARQTQARLADALVAQAVA